MEKKCDLCNKDRRNYIGLVWYSDDEGTETELCRSCHSRWFRSKDCKTVEREYADAKPTTKKYFKRCRELQKSFNGWFKKQTTKK